MPTSFGIEADELLAILSAHLGLDEPLDVLAQTEDGKKGLLPKLERLVLVTPDPASTAAERLHEPLKP
jgi:hypothetical protein